MVATVSIRQEHALWPFYKLTFGALAALLALSPLLRSLSLDIPFDRICELLVALMVVWTVMAKQFQLPRTWSAAAITTVCFMLVSAAVNWQFSPLFHPTLVLLDTKILLCVVSMWIFGGASIPDSARRQLSSMIYGGFVLGVLVFGMLNAGSGQRLKLLDESNYMVLGLIISSITLIDAHRVKTMSPAWLSIFAMLLVALWLAQSRTGFVTVGLVGLGMLWAAREKGIVLTLGYAVLLAVVLDFDQVLASLTRGETVDEIDRLVFVRELWLQWSQRPLLDVLFGNHVGTYLSENTYGMHYWVARQTAEHGIPFGLSPFNFHALYLRLPLDIGLIPAAALLTAIYIQLRRTTSGYVVLALMVSGLSMSVFYLSAIMPFIVLAQLVRPAWVHSQRAAPALKSALGAGNRRQGPSLDTGHGEAGQ